MYKRFSDAAEHFKMTGMLGKKADHRRKTLNNVKQIQDTPYIYIYFIKL